MEPTSLFEITRRQNRAGNASGKYPSAAVRGLALGAHASDALSFDKAEHDNFIGFLTRDVVADGLTFTQRVFGVPGSGSVPVGFETPFTAGGEVSLEKAHEIEIEGTDYLYSGTGQITEATTIPQNVSLKEGKWRKTQSGENVNGMLTAVGLTSRGGVGALRVRIEIYWGRAASDDGAPVTAPVLTIGPTPFAPELMWTQESVPTTNAIWRSQNGGAFALVATQSGALTSYDDVDSLPEGDLWCYKIIPSEGGVESNVACADFNSSLDSDTALSYPTLVVAYENLSYDDDVTIIETVDLPELLYVIGTAFFDAFFALTSLTLPKLQTVGIDLHTSISGITSLSLPVLTDVAGDIFCDSCTALTTVSIPALVFHNGQTIAFDNCALSAASVNHILARGVASGVTGSTFRLDGGTNAAPTGQGIIDAAALVTAGNTVTTN